MSKMEGRENEETQVMEKKEWRGEPYCLSRWWVGNLRGGKVAQ